MAGGYRGVSGEDYFTGNARYSFVEAQALLQHATANRFQHGKSAVAFVQVKDARRDPQRFQSAEASNPEQQLLPNPDASISALQPRGHFPAFGTFPTHPGANTQTN